MDRQIEIRPAVPEDAEGMAHLHVAAWRGAYRGLVADSYLDRLDPGSRAARWKVALSGDTEETFCAVRDGEIAGILTIGACRDDDVDSRTTGEIWGIYLAPSVWRKGIGRTLCRYGEEVLRTRGFTELTLWVFEENARARRFYEAEGYWPDGKAKTYTIGGQFLAGVRYRKPPSREP